MAETTIRVKVISDFYGTGLKVHKEGDSLELPSGLARELIASNKAVLDNAPKTQQEKQVVKDEAAAQVRDDKRSKV